MKEWVNPLFLIFTETLPCQLRQGFYVEIRHFFKKSIPYLYDNVMTTENYIVEGGVYMRQGVLQEVERIITPILESRDNKLFDLELVQEGSEMFLRIYIDNDRGVDLDECSIVSELVSEALDTDDPIEGAYFLEVSSPGAERPLNSLAEIKQSIGKNVYVTLYVHIDGEKAYEGIVQSVENDTVTIEYKYRTQRKTVSLPYEKIAKARLAVML